MSAGTVTTPVARSRVIGTGGLARFLAARITPDVPVLVARLDRLRHHADTLDEPPVLPVTHWRSFVYIGPIWRGGTGCPDCLAARVANSSFGPDMFGDEPREAVPAEAETPIGPGTLRLLEILIRERTQASDTDTASVLVVDTVAGTVEAQFLLPDSTCARCGEPERDTLPELTDGALPKLGPDRLRTRELDAALVDHDYLFSGLGLFKELRQDLQSPFGACSVELPSAWGRREPAIGRARGYLTARTVAVLEGLERYAGMHRGGRRTLVRAAYQDIAERAVHPPELGVHPADSYATPGFHYREFAPDTVVDWAWAYSFRRGEPVLVPERCVFWGPRHDGEISFFFDTSNGCALGNSVEEAVLHGLREVVERDSYLLSWYRRLALPEVDLSAERGELAELLRKCELFTGFGFRCFESTMEYGVPSFWLVAENRTDDGPAVLTGSGAHPDPRQAIVGGLYELAGIVLATRHGYAERRAEALSMVDDPNLVRTMEHHSLAGSPPQARSRYGFLLDVDHDVVPLERVPGIVRAEETDLRADLDAMVSRILASGMDVLVCDQTMPELSRNGLRCVKVIVPGMVPMTFGHRNRRTVGLPRLSGAVELPYRSGLADGEEIGCVPHPFP